MRPGKVFFEIQHYIWYRKIRLLHPHLVLFELLRKAEVLPYGFSLILSRTTYSMPFFTSNRVHMWHDALWFSIGYILSISFCFQVFAWFDCFVVFKRTIQILNAHSMSKKGVCHHVHIILSCLNIKNNSHIFWWNQSVISSRNGSLFKK